MILMITNICYVFDTRKAGAWQVEAREKEREISSGKFVVEEKISHGKFNLFMIHEMFYCSYFIIVTLRLTKLFILVGML